MTPGAGRRTSRSVRPFWPAGLVIVAAVAAALVFWPWIGAQLRAAVVLSTVLQTPVLEETSRLLTAEPEIEDRTIAGVETTVASPGGQGPWPTLVFVNGSTPRGRDEPSVERLAEGLARAGYLVYVPDLPGLRSGEITARTLAATVGVGTEAAEDPEALGGQVGLAGVSVGASLALLAAADPDLRNRVSVVAGVAPYAELEGVIRLATTETYRDDGEISRRQVPGYLRLVVGRSAAAMLEDEEDRNALLSALPTPKEYLADANAADPLSALSAPGFASEEDLGAQARDVVRLLVNEDPARFERLYARTPQRMREVTGGLSPLADMEDIRAPVELVSAPRDKYFPVPRMRELAREAPEGRLTVTPALSHAQPDPSLGGVSGLLRLDAFLIRSLREAHPDQDQVSYYLYFRKPMIQPRCRAVDVRRR